LGLVASDEGKKFYKIETWFIFNFFFGVILGEPTSLRQRYKSLFSCVSDAAADGSF
jgi:hypothetical protein